MLKAIDVNGEGGGGKGMCSILILIYSWVKQR
jgi:hypothetical protein